SQMAVHALTKEALVWHSIFCLYVFPHSLHNFTSHVQNRTVLRLNYDIEPLLGLIIRKNSVGKFWMCSICSVRKAPSMNLVLAPSAMRSRICFSAEPARRRSGPDIFYSSPGFTSA